MLTHEPRDWLDFRQAPLGRRGGPAPAELVDYVRLVNQATDVPAVPEAVLPAEDFAADVEDAMAELPARLRAMLDRSLLGVFFARDLGCSVVTDVVLHEGEPLGAVVALDMEVLRDHTANTWATLRENEPFRRDGRQHREGGSGLQVVLEHGGQDVRRNALQFLLLHEFGHALTAGGNFLPDWWTRPADLAPAASYPFLALSWDIDEQRRIVPNPDNSFPLRERVKSHTSPELERTDYAGLYGQLALTTFPTLYAADNAYDDFAECFAVYVHSIMMGRPYEVHLTGEHPTLLADSHSLQARCPEKFAFVKNLIDNAA
ncbi:MAG: hypothetical protein V4505_12495 [Pseudomonadota bacterium]